MQAYDIFWVYQRAEATIQPKIEETGAYKGRQDVSNCLPGVDIARHKWKISVRMVNELVEEET